MSVLLVGLGILKDDKLLAAMTRHGKPLELLYGPLMFGAVSVIWTIVWWRDSPYGIIGLAALYAGDGLAGLLGLMLGRALGPLPHNRDKTWVGSIACMVGTLAGSVVLLRFLALWEQPSGPLFLACAAASVAAAAVESLPIQEWDNLTVPITATMVAMVTLNFAS